MPSKTRNARPLRTFWRRWRKNITQAIIQRKDRNDVYSRDAFVALDGR